ncbi:uncharacterized protein LOC142786872 isoform X1 [Rhipicephalus microplus]|uniref:uncharacterized protein LOC142786872 isoform X1 n=1 Tax=Rhipicephalus microplus TaxID=6941 RepID=UPI003F6C9A0E
MGFLVMVHGRGFRADACADSVFAQPGYITYIGLIQRRRAALPEPYQPPCRDTWPSRLKYYLQNTTRYTREKNTGTAFAKFVLSWTCRTCNNTAAVHGPALMSTITRNSHSPPSLRISTTTKLLYGKVESSAEQL